ncbi:MAG TPA: sialidase family protein [Saprospiraceae bacterium]|nr:sialidase family protein [Saprospiraceae bacterium]
MNNIVLKLVLIGIFYLLLSAMTCNKDSEILVAQNIESTIILNQSPIFTDDSSALLADFDIINQNEIPIELNQFTIELSNQLKHHSFKFISIIYKGSKGSTPLYQQFQTTSNLGLSNIILAKLHLSKGTHQFQIRTTVSPEIDLLNSFRIKGIQLHNKGNIIHTVTPKEEYTFRPCIKVRQGGQDNCDTYRIPGLITTNNGTLIMVYDNRYNNSKDLQEDVDIGMSRSTDGGQTWEPMKVIMDMGTYGGRSQRLNGIGDPAVLYDPNTHTTWVAALWMSGLSPDQMLWWASNPGMTPEETGQFILSKSTDDGLTWSTPINITSQIKKPEWQLLLQGPGMGITLVDGTLVFPAQFKADIGQSALDGGKYTCHSTIVYSTDKGKTWKIGEGAKSNTTEAQVVQLQNGDLMLNMRDDRNRKDKTENNGRAVAITKDMGKTWLTHPSSNSGLQEPNCMASLISTTYENKKLLIFSNPNDKAERINMTIKLSTDEGKTWPLEHQIKLNASKGYGYSCLTMIDRETIGIVYEGIKDLYFQKISLQELLSK